MSRSGKIIVAITVVVIGALVCIAIGLVYTKIRHVPEAYAAWDTGTLLVEYMKGHDDRWPSSWEDLLSIMDSESGRQIPLRGAQAGDINYARSLRKIVSIDWTFNPARRDNRSPVTRLNGTAFPVVWHGAEPNEMIHEYLRTRARSPKTDSTAPR